MKSLIILFAVLFVMVVLKVTLDVKETFDYMNHKSKCYDCEKQILAMEGPANVWKAQPTKSFDSERQDGWLAKTIKYY